MFKRSSPKISVESAQVDLEMQMRGSRNLIVVVYVCVGDVGVGVWVGWEFCNGEDSQN